MVEVTMFVDHRIAFLQQTYRRPYQIWIAMILCLRHPYVYTHVGRRANLLCVPDPRRTGDMNQHEKSNLLSEAFCRPYRWPLSSSGQSL
jgi:hypothetical protein